MIPGRPVRPDVDSSNSPTTMGNLAVVIACAALFVFVQVQLIWGIAAIPGGGIGRALEQWMLRGQTPHGPVVSYQLPAPIAEARLNDLPADIAGRAKPVLDWLSETRGLQQGGSVRIFAENNSLTLDIYGMDEIGCRRIMQATRSGSARIDSIAVTATAAEMIPLPTSIPDEEQCKKATNFMRMVRASRAADGK